MKPFIRTKKIKRSSYYYVVEPIKEGGRWRQRQTYLGTPQTLLAKLSQAQAPLDVSFRSFGDVAALFLLPRTRSGVHLAAIIDRHLLLHRESLPVGDLLVLAAINRCCAPTSKAGISPWYRKTVLPELMGPGSGPGQALRQVGLALAVTRSLGFPLLHQVYCGSTHDAKLFPKVIPALIDRWLRLSRGAGKVTLVFDKGSNSHPNLRLLENRPEVSFLGSLVPSHHQDLLRVDLSHYQDLPLPAESGSSVTPEGLPHPEGSLWSQPDGGGHL